MEHNSKILSKSYKNKSGKMKQSPNIENGQMESIKHKKQITEEIKRELKWIQKSCKEIDEVMTRANKDNFQLLKSIKRHTNSLADAALSNSVVYSTKIWQGLKNLWKSIKNLLEINMNSIDNDVLQLIKWILTSIIDYALCNRNLNQQDNSEFERFLSEADEYQEDMSMDIILSCRTIINPKYRNSNYIYPILRKVAKKHSKKVKDIHNFLKLCMLVKISFMSKMNKTKNRSILFEIRKSMSIPKDLKTWAVQNDISWFPYKNPSLKMIAKNIDVPSTYQMLYHYQFESDNAGISNVGELNCSKKDFNCKSDFVIKEDNNQRGCHVKRKVSNQRGGDIVQDVKYQENSISEEKKQKERTILKENQDMSKSTLNKFVPKKKLRKPRSLFEEKVVLQSKNDNYPTSKSSYQSTEIELEESTSTPESFTRPRNLFNVKANVEKNGKNRNTVVQINQKDSTLEINGWEVSLKPPKKVVNGWEISPVQPKKIVVKPAPEIKAMKSKQGNDNNLGSKGDNVKRKKIDLSIIENKDKYKRIKLTGSSSSEELNTCFTNNKEISLKCKNVIKKNSGSSSNDANRQNALKVQKITLEKSNTMDKNVPSIPKRCRKRKDKVCLKTRPNKISAVDSSDDEAAVPNKRRKRRRRTKREPEVTKCEGKQAIKTNVSKPKISSAPNDSDSDLQIIDEVDLMEHPTSVVATNKDESEVDEAPGSDGDIVPCDEANKMFSEEETLNYHKRKQDEIRKEEEKELQRKVLEIIENEEIKGLEITEEENEEMKDLEILESDDNDSITVQENVNHISKSKKKNRNSDIMMPLYQKSDEILETTMNGEMEIKAKKVEKESETAKDVRKECERNDGASETYLIEEEEEEENNNNNNDDDDDDDLAIIFDTIKMDTRKIGIAGELNSNSEKSSMKEECASDEEVISMTSSPSVLSSIKEARNASFNSDQSSDFVSKIFDSLYRRPSKSKGDSNVEILPNSSKYNMNKSGNSIVNDSTPYLKNFKSRSSIHGKVKQTTVPIELESNIDLTLSDCQLIEDKSLHEEQVNPNNEDSSVCSVISNGSDKFGNDQTGPVSRTEKVKAQSNGINKLDEGSLSSLSEIADEALEVSSDASEELHPRAQKKWPHNHQTSTISNTENVNASQNLDTNDACSTTQENPIEMLNNSIQKISSPNTINEVKRSRTIDSLSSIRDSECSDIQAKDFNSPACNTITGINNNPGYKNKNYLPVSPAFSDVSLKIDELSDDPSEENLESSTKSHDCSELSSKLAANKALNKSHSPPNVPTENEVKGSVNSVVSDMKVAEGSIPSVENSGSYVDCISLEETVLANNVSEAVNEDKTVDLDASKNCSNSDDSIASCTKLQELKGTFSKSYNACSTDVFENEVDLEVSNGLPQEKIPPEEICSSEINGKEFFVIKTIENKENIVNNEQEGEELEVLSTPSLEVEETECDSSISVDVPAINLNRKIPNKVGSPLKQLIRTAASPRKDLLVVKRNRGSPKEVKSPGKRDLISQFLTPQKVSTAALSSEVIISPEVSDEENEVIQKTDLQVILETEELQEIHPDPWIRSKSPQKIIQEEQDDDCVISHVIKVSPTWNNKQSPSKLICKTLKNNHIGSTKSTTFSEQKSPKDQQDTNSIDDTKAAPSFNTESFNSPASDSNVSRNDNQNKNNLNSTSLNAVGSNAISLLTLRKSSRFSEKENETDTSANTKSSKSDLVEVSDAYLTSENEASSCAGASEVDESELRDKVLLSPLKRVTRSYLLRRSTKLEQSDVIPDIINSPRRRRTSLSSLKNEDEATLPKCLDSPARRTRRNSGTVTPLTPVRRSRRISGIKEEDVITM